MLQNLKSSLGRNYKKLSVGLFAGMIAAMSCFSSFAAEDTSGISTALSNGLDTLKSDLLGYIAIVVPVAIAIVAAYLGIKKAIGFVQGLIGR